MQGLILFAHGARDPRWAEPFERTARRLRALHPDGPVALAYLEFMAPDLARCGAELVAAGCTEVSVLPVFLGAGGHVRKDLPERVATLRAEHPGVQWRLHTAAGESDTLVEALAQWALASSSGAAQGEAR
jgi:sirohydrochlorin cobaltochelatase